MYSPWLSYSHCFPHPFTACLEAHTCHISHCEIKSHRIWPIWKPSPRRFFKSHRIFRPSYNIFYKKINTDHTVVFITSFLHLNKGFGLFWRCSKVIFVKISQNIIRYPIKICLISQISVHSLWHVWKFK